MKRWIGWISLALMAGLALGWLQDLSPIFDSFTHFRLVWSALLAVMFVALIFTRQYILSFLAALTIVASMSLTHTYLWPSVSAQASTQGGKADLKILQFNLLWKNPHMQKAISVVLAADADVVVFQESGWTNRTIVDTLRQHFKYATACNTGKNGRRVILSNLEFDQSFGTLCPRGNALSIARVKVQGQWVSIANVHLRWPWPFSQHRRAHLMQKTLSSVNGPFIVAGDFNAVPWSHIAKRIAAMSGTTIAKEVRLSWGPAITELNFWMPPTLPIDLVMSRGVTLIERRVLPYGGSDHRPVLNRFALN